MEHTASPRLHPSGSGWQLHGELELPAGADAAELIRAQLTKMLEPLHLHADFLEKLLKSAQDSAERARQPNAGVTFGHIHLSVFTPNERAPGGNTWGFFRIEKIDGAESNKDHPEHAVEFYLYLEGQ